ncbi:MAG: 4'-phosphopantetheinyl transferase superfamily protein, partial [Bacteroidaceae bacterium]|nr:4'-phosphopantetheinyl transferase superfamily protein [Bacteroidaceae bacterium]
MVYIYDKIQDFTAERLEESLACLSDQRREKAMAFKHELGRKQCVIAYMLLCQGLREEFGIDEKPVFEYGEHGKPVIVGHSDIHFNLSHCATGVACAVSSRPIGIDIESVRSVRESVVRYSMNEQEQQEIFSSATPDLTFTILWTKKESVLKLTGEGINDNMKSILLPEKLKG